MSIDFTVPSDAWEDLLLRPPPPLEEGAAAGGTGRVRVGDAYDAAIRTGRDGEWVIPLGWLARGPLVGFDLRQDGSSLPLLLGTEIGVVTKDLLELELDVCLDAVPSDPESDLASRALALIDRCVSMKVATGVADDIERFSLDYGEAVASLVELMRATAVGFLLLAIVPRVDRRQLVKLAFDEPVPRVRDGSVVFFDTPGVFESATSHLECPLPVELRARAWFMQALETSTELSEVVEHDDHPSLYVTAEDLQRKLDRAGGAGETVGVLARHMVPRWRFHLPATVLALIGSLVVAYGAWIADLDAIVRQSRQGPVITLLLAGVALFVALLLRLDEHSAARRMLRTPRVLLSAVLLAVLAAAAALAFAGAHTTAVWRALTFVLALLVAGLVAAAWKGYG